MYTYVYKMTHPKLMLNPKFKTTSKKFSVFTLNLIVINFILLIPEFLTNSFVL